MAIDLALVKAHLRVTHSSEDALIQQYAAAAALHVEQMCGRLLGRREVTQVFSRLCGRLPLVWGPDVDGLTLGYFDSAGAPQELDVAGGGVRIVRGSLVAGAAGWPAIEAASEIVATYTAGYAEGAVPADLVNAQLLLIGHWYQNREAVNVGGAPSEYPLGVEALMAPYRPVML